MSDKKLWDEFCAMEKERDALRAELGELRSSMEFRTSLIGRTEEERDALRAELDAMKKAFACVHESHETLYQELRARPVPTSMPERITPEQAPEDVRDYCEEAAEGYADGWNACVKAMLNA